MTTSSGCPGLKEHTLKYEINIAHTISIDHFFPDFIAGVHAILRYKRKCKSWDSRGL